jgi:hypothetical protein
MIVLASRQSGKSACAGVLAIKQMLVHPPSLIIVVSPSMRQSTEIFRTHVMGLFRAIGSPIAISRQTELTLELTTGSRCICLPSSEQTIRGYSSVSLIIYDEAARIADETFVACKPMVSVSNGKIICLSTPCGRSGFFYRAWTDEPEWEKVRVSAEECPRISKQFLESERRSLGPRWFDAEYLCNFSSVSGAVFSQDDIQAMLVAPRGKKLEVCMP